MNKPFAMLLAAAGLALGACSGAPTDEPPLQGAAIGGPFNLIDQTGRPFDEARLQGKYRLVYFGYSYCPDVCPVDLQKLMQGLRAFERSDPARAAKLQPIFVTVDPKRDTPAVLRQYVAAFHPRLIGLTGSDAQIAAAAKRYAVYYKQRPADGGVSGYLMDHGRQTMLFGPAGEPIALVAQEGTAEQIAAEYARWVK